MSRLAVAGVALAWVLAAGCGAPPAQRTNGKMYKMGERVQVGPLIYTVLDTEWLDSLGGGQELRMPRHRFLAVRVSVTNSGIATSGIPPMTLTGAGGNSYSELTDARGLSDWLGYLRTVRAAETVYGRALFDVPADSYRLNLTDDAEPDKMKVATVDLPLQVNTTLPVNEVPK